MNASYFFPRQRLHQRFICFFPAMITCDSMVERSLTLTRPEVTLCAIFDHVMHIFLPLKFKMRMLTYVSFLQSCEWPLQKTAVVVAEVVEVVVWMDDFRRISLWFDLHVKSVTCTGCEEDGEGIFRHNTMVERCWRYLMCRWMGDMKKKERKRETFQEERMSNSQLEKMQHMLSIASVFFLISACASLCHRLSQKERIQLFK